MRPTTKAAPTRADQAEQVFTWGIFAYSALRVIPVWGALRDGSVNPWIFLAIDLGTAWPYAKSWPRLVRSLAARDVDRATFWGAVLTGSFVAPYLYVALAGEAIASWVWWVMGAFILLGAASTAIRIRKGLAEEAAA